MDGERICFYFTFVSAGNIDFPARFRCSLDTNLIRRFFREFSSREKNGILIPLRARDCQPEQEMTRSDRLTGE